MKNQDSNFVVLDLPKGATELKERSTADLDSVRGQDWRGLAATDWLSGNDQGASELIAVRAARDPFRTDLFVYGDPFNRVSRDTGLERTKAQWDQSAWYQQSPSGRVTIDIEALKASLRDTHTNALSWNLEQPGDYIKFVDFLEATKDLAVDGKQPRVWVTLLTPKAMDPVADDGIVCSLPEESRLTTWSEFDYFKKGIYGIFASCGKEVEVQGPPGEPTVKVVPCAIVKTSLAGRR